jgi:hypothetical protein
VGAFAGQEVGISWGCDRRLNRIIPRQIQASISNGPARRRERHIGEARKYFFLKKRNKNFDYDRPSGARAPLFLSASGLSIKQKFFGSFFQKRTAFLALVFL